MHTLAHAEHRRPPLPYVLQVLAFPVQMLVRFWVNHHLLDLVQRPCWRVVKGRSKSYVDKVLAGMCVACLYAGHTCAGSPLHATAPFEEPCHGPLLRSKVNSAHLPYLVLLC